MSDILKRLHDHGIIIPTPAKPVANYVGYMQTGNLIYTAGQLPMLDGKPMLLGLLGDSVSIEDGTRCARQAAINVIAQLKDAVGGDLERIKRIVKITGFVACTASFTEHPKVMNGASDLFVAVFGDKGKHARSAVGVASLPFGAPVEVEAIAEIYE